VLIRVPRAKFDHPGGGFDEADDLIVMESVGQVPRKYASTGQASAKTASDGRGWVKHG
jgi:hypothetical protein